MVRRSSPSLGVGSVRTHRPDVRASRFEVSADPRRPRDACSSRCRTPSARASEPLMCRSRPRAGDRPSTGRRRQACRPTSPSPPSGSTTQPAPATSTRSRELLDPNTFVYNFDDGSDPIPAWRQDPSVLDLMVAVLELPAADPRVDRGIRHLHHLALPHRQRLRRAHRTRARRPRLIGVHRGGHPAHDRRRTRLPGTASCHRRDGPVAELHHRRRVSRARRGQGRRMRARRKSSTAAHSRTSSSTM